jgi:hypothetical protein
MKFIDPFEINLYPNKQVSTLLKENNMLKSKNKEIIITMIAITLVVTAVSTYTFYKNKKLTNQLKLKNGN